MQILYALSVFILKYPQRIKTVILHCLGTNDKIKFYVCSVSSQNVSDLW